MTDAAAVRPATATESAALDALFAEVDALHRQARPELYRAPEPGEPARPTARLDALI